MISGVLLGIIFIIATKFSKNGSDKSIVFLNFVVVFLKLNNLQAFSLENVFTNAPFFVKRLQIPWYGTYNPFFLCFFDLLSKG